MTDQLRLTGAVLTFSTGVSALACHTPGPGPARVGPLARPLTGSVFLLAVERGEILETPWGTAHLWSVTWADPLNIP